MKYSFRLFITGITSHSQRAICNLKEICNSKLEGEFEVEIIDVLEHPELAEMEKIMAVPTLIRKQPSPSKRIIGDLSEQQLVLTALDLE